MTREEIRQQVKEARSHVSGIQVAEMSLRVCERVVMLPEYLKAHRVMCYWSLPEEVQTFNLLREIRRGGRELYLPVTKAEHQMEAVRMEADTPLKKGPFDVMEPIGEPTDPALIDLVLTPGVAFDKRGNRLGYGGGYFDSFLKYCHCPIVGLAYDLQIVPAIDPQPLDVPMDKVITETTVIDCRRIG